MTAKKERYDLWNIEVAFRPEVTIRWDFMGKEVTWALGMPDSGGEVAEVVRSTRVAARSKEAAVELAKKQLLEEASRQRFPVKDMTVELNANLLSARKEKVVCWLLASSCMDAGEGNAYLCNTVEEALDKVQELYEACDITSNYFSEVSPMEQMTILPTYLDKLCADLGREMSPEYGDVTEVDFFFSLTPYTGEPIEVRVY